MTNKAVVKMNVFEEKKEMISAITVQKIKAGTKKNKQTLNISCYYLTFFSSFDVQVSGRNAHCGKKYKMKYEQL